MCSKDVLLKAYVEPLSSEYLTEVDSSQLLQPKPGINRPDRVVFIRSVMSNKKDAAFVSPLSPTNFWSEMHEQGENLVLQLNAHAWPNIRLYDFSKIRQERFYRITISLICADDGSCSNLVRSMWLHCRMMLTRHYHCPRACSYSIR